MKTIICTINKIELKFSALTIRSLTQNLFLISQQQVLAFFILDCVVGHCIGVKTSMICSQPNKAVERGVCRPVVLAVDMLNWRDLWSQNFPSHFSLLWRSTKVQTQEFFTRFATRDSVISTK